MNEEKIREDLKQYYKKVLKCKKCGTLYGSDRTSDKYNNLCPNCEWDLVYGEKELKSKKKNSSWKK